MLRHHKRRDRGAGAYLAALAALVVGCVVWPAAAIATPQHVAHVRVATANSQTFNDATGDSGSAPDVTSVTVSNDDKGQITFAISVPNRSSLSSNDFLLILVDTNGNLSDGLAGADYAVGIAGPAGLLFSAASGTPAPVTPASPFSTSFANGVQTVSVNKSDIGNPTQINFFIASSGDGGTTIGDVAPDGGPWNYQVTIAPPPPLPPPPPPPPPPLKLAASTPHLSTALAGGLFTASIVVTNSSTGKRVKGTITCTASLGGKPLPAVRHTSTASGTATCAWRLPLTAHGKQLKGTITASYQGKKVSRSFSATVK